MSANYELLREDALRNLIEAVQGVKENPTASEDAFNGAVGIYEKVHCDCVPSVMLADLFCRSTFVELHALLGA